MSEVPDYSLDGPDRPVWDRAWRSMPHRRLTAPPHLPFDDRLGAPISTTVSENPPEFSDYVSRDSELCPICGVSTKKSPRLPASLHPRWERVTFGIGVWVHRSCFESCPPADQPAPIPW